MRHIKFMLVSVVAVAVLTALAISAFSLLSSGKSSPAATGTGDSDSGSSECSSETSYNFLFLGVDEASSSSDVIMLARFDKTGKISVVQIPRDTYVCEMGRINTVFASACAKALSSGLDKRQSLEKGAQAMRDFFSSSLGIKTDAYAVLTLEALENIVNAAGGVEVSLDRDLDYDDPSQDLHIHLKKGDVCLDGKSACGLVRMRSAYLSADYGRMDAQKIFMAAFFKKVKTSLSPLETIALLKAAYSSTVTDMSMTQLVSFARIALRADEEDILFSSVKGEMYKTESHGAVIVAEILQKENLEAISAIFAGDGDTEADYEAFCDGTEEARRMFEKAPLYPLSFSSVREIEENGITIR